MAMEEARRLIDEINACFDQINACLIRATNHQLPLQLRMIGRTCLPARMPPHCLRSEKPPCQREQSSAAELLPQSEISRATELESL